MIVENKIIRNAKERKEAYYKGCIGNCNKCTQRGCWTSYAPSAIERKDTKRLEIKLGRIIEGLVYIKNRVGIKKNAMC